MSVGLPLFEQLDRQTAQRRLILARARGLSLTPMHGAVRQCVSLGRSCLGATSRVPVGVCLRRPRWTRRAEWTSTLRRVSAGERRGSP